MTIRFKFIVHMLVYMAVMIVVLLTINAKFYTLCVIWTLFAYIILKEIVDFIARSRQPKRLARWPVVFRINHFKIKGDNMEVVLHLDEVVPFKLGKPIDSDGAERPIEDGSLTKVITDESIFTEEQDDELPDDPEARMFVAQKVGTADYNVEADADLGEGVTKIALTVKVTVLDPEAVGFAPLQLGAARKKKPA